MKLEDTSIWICITLLSGLISGWIALGIGIVGYIVCKDADPAGAKRVLIVGFVVWAIIFTINLVYLLQALERLRRWF